MNKTDHLDRAIVRFAGDSGDGMQLLGGRFTYAAARSGADVATFPDFPAEIRAPAGTREGVSGYQIQFAGADIHTPGDEADALVAMNPAALVTNLPSVVEGGLVLVNTDKFKPADLTKARLDRDPLEDGSLQGYRVVPVPMSSMTKDAVEPFGLKTKQADRCKNFFAMGIVFWLYGHDPEPQRSWIRSKFKAPFAEANLAAFEAGWSYADTAELLPVSYRVRPAETLDAGVYKGITGNAALALGLVAAAQRVGRPLFYGSYPITPASDILHGLAPFKNHGVVTFQAEDEIAAICAAIGASYGGNVGVTGTSGPGLALKSEALNLAVMAELPLVVVNVQRGGPSTGLPTKTEQADLMQAFFGRNGESPLVVIAPASPTECFDMAFEAVRIAVEHTVPVVLLSDGYLANGAEPWPIPDLDTLPAITPPALPPVESFRPYDRDPDTLVRPWVPVGTPGYEHRIGGLEKQDGTGNVSYDPKNHDHMTKIRARKVARVADTLPPLEVHGDAEGVLVLGWGSTFGAIRDAVDLVRAEGHAVAHVHLRHLMPLPNDLGALLGRYERILIPELNLGQLRKLIRGTYLVAARGLDIVEGRPFRVSEVIDAIHDLLAAPPTRPEA